MYVCMLTTLTNTKVAFADLKDGLVAYYPFNGNANDESGNGNNGTVSGATLTTDSTSNTTETLTLYSNTETEYYNGTDWTPAAKAWVHSWWTNIQGAEWIWESYLVKNPSNEETVNFRKTFTIPNNVNLDAIAGTIKIAVDDSVSIKLNGSYVGEYMELRSTKDFDISSFLVSGQNTLNLSVTNYNNGASSPYDNPAGVIFAISIKYSYVTTPTPSPTTGTTPTPAVSPTTTPTPTPSETGIVFGYVYDEDENPLRGVTVKIDGDDYSDNSTTDEDGYYEFDKVPAGDYTITYTKTGYVTQTAEAIVVDGDKVAVDIIVMQVAQKGSIYGYVVNIKGDPIESVRLTFNGIGIKVKKTASTDRDGFFEFKDLEAGIYRIVAKKRFYKAAQQTVELEEGEDKEIEIEMKKTTKRIKLEGVLD